MTALLPLASTLTALVEDAVRAPSSHNTQPWLFRLLEDGVELHADRRRALPVNDPHDRELLISCGAALTNLCASAEHHHLAARVDVWPDPDDSDHLATVHVTPTPPYSDERLAYGIRLRGTWREPFTPRLVAPDVLAELLDAADLDGVWTHVVSPAERPELVGLVASGDRFQFHDASWRRELAAWMHPRRSGDGLTVPPMGGALTRFVVTHADLGATTAEQDDALTRNAPVVLALGTDRDDEAAWFTAGRALQRLLLVAAVRGVQAGWSNQPCQVDVLRPALASLLGRPHPQVVLRLGYPPETRAASARRPVEDVLIG